MPDIAASLTDAVLTKRCSSCQEELPVAMFHRNITQKDGLRTNCKKCSTNEKRIYDKANPIKVQTAHMICGARKRAKKKNLEFNINSEYIRSLVVSHCPVFGIPLEWSCHRGEHGNKPLENSPSLDRIDPTKGYIKGNVWIISNKANTTKSNSTHEELKLVTKAVGEAIVKSLEF
jgi:hypothetical protein